MLVLMWVFGIGLGCRWFRFAKRYRRLWIVGTGSSMGQKRWASISAFMSLRSHLRCSLRAHLGLAPKVLFLLSIPWTSDHSVLSLSLAKGRRILDSPPNSLSHINSATSTAANHSTKTNQSQSKKQPTNTNPHNFKDENGTWIQCIFAE